MVRRGRVSFRWATSLRRTTERRAASCHPWLALGLLGRAVGPSALVVCAWLLGLLLTGCGAKTDSVGGDRSLASDAESGDGGSPPGDGGALPGRHPSCPASPPAAGTPCTPILSCDYASDAGHGLCTTHSECASTQNSGPFTWIPSQNAVCTKGNPAACPATFSSLSPGVGCPGDRSLCCAYPEGACGCTPCQADALSSMWVCRGWGPDQPECPAEPPLVGDACNDAGAYCSYGSPCRVQVGWTVACQNGYWAGAGGGGSCLLPACGEL
jgi:hypothetical protein